MARQRPQGGRACAPEIVARFYRQIDDAKALLEASSDFGGMLNIWPEKWRRFIEAGRKTQAA